MPSLVSVLSFLGDTPKYQVVFFQMCINHTYFWDQNFAKKLQVYLSSYLIVNRGKVISFFIPDFSHICVLISERPLVCVYFMISPINFNGKTEFHYMSGLNLRNLSLVNIPDVLCFHYYEQHFDKYPVHMPLYHVLWFLYEKFLK